MWNLKAHWMFLASRIPRELQGIFVILLFFGIFFGICGLEARKALIRGGASLWLGHFQNKACSPESLNIAEARSTSRHVEPHELTASPDVTAFAERKCSKLNRAPSALYSPNNASGEPHRPYTCKIHLCKISAGF